MRTYLIVALAVLGIFVTPVFAQLGSQAFPDVNFSNENITDAKITVAETAFSNPGLLPDSPLYFFKRVKENAQLFLTFNDEQKAKLHLELAKTRLSEARALVEKNKTREVETAVNEFSDEVDKLEASQGIGRNVSAFVKDTNETLEKSRIVLALVLQKVPDQAKPAIERALNNTVEKKVRIEINSNETDSEKAKIRIEEKTKRELEKNNEIKDTVRKIKERSESEKQNITRSETTRTSEIIEKTKSETERTVREISTQTANRIGKSLPSIEK